jgi:hypothetical protein
MKKVKLFLCGLPATFSEEKDSYDIKFTDVTERDIKSLVLNGKELYVIVKN